MKRWVSQVGTRAGCGICFQGVCWICIPEKKFSHWNMQTPAKSQVFRSARWNSVCSNGWTIWSQGVPNGWVQGYALEGDLEEGCWWKVWNFLSQREGMAASSLEFFFVWLLGEMAFLLTKKVNPTRFQVLGNVISRHPQGRCPWLPWYWRHQRLSNWLLRIYHTQWNHVGRAPNLCTKTGTAKWSHSPLITAILKFWKKYPPRNDHTSHQTETGKSSTQKWQTVVDMWSYTQDLPINW